VPSGRFLNKNGVKAMVKMLDVGMEKVPNLSVAEFQKLLNLPTNFTKP